MTIAGGLAATAARTAFPAICAIRRPANNPASCSIRITPAKVPIASSPNRIRSAVNRADRVPYEDLIAVLHHTVSYDCVMQLDGFVLALGRELEQFFHRYDSWAEESA